jgi:rfaE bifunctional protein kinase chain/domain
VDKQKKDLLKLIERFPRKRIAVWGDFILDEYVFGTTRRISREAPVLILSYRNKEFSLGGAGNAVLNLKSLGAEPFPVGILGSDNSGKKIIQMFKDKGIPTNFLIQEGDYQTPLKTRILAGEESTRKQQILRIDQESQVPERSDLKRKIRKSLENVRRRISALLISDYNYLAVKEDIFNCLLPLYKKSNVPVTLDSRFRLLKFKGVTVSTPNEPEVEAATGIELKDSSQLKKTGRFLLNKSRAAAVLITRGSKGMALFERNKPPFLIPIIGTTDIVDVTGAGDTVISVLTLALSCSATFREAALLANYAGSVVVMKKGTATLSIQELKEAVVS